VRLQRLIWARVKGERRKRGKKTLSVLKVRIRRTAKEMHKKKKKKEKAGTVTYSTHRHSLLRWHLFMGTE
jgi:hypothetical protein